MSPRPGRAFIPLPLLAEGAEGRVQRPRTIPLDASRIPLADPRSRTPLEELAGREELPDRIGNLGRWLREWGRAGKRSRAMIAGMDHEPPATADVPSHRSFDLTTLRERLDGRRCRGD